MLSTGRKIIGYPIFHVNNLRTHVNSSRAFFTSTIPLHAGKPRSKSKPKKPSPSRPTRQPPKQPPKADFPNVTNQIKEGSNDITVRVPADFDMSKLQSMSQEEIVKLLNINMDELETFKIDVETDKNEGFNTKITDEDDEVSAVKTSNNNQGKSKNRQMNLVESSFDPSDPRKPPAGRNSINMLRGCKVRSTDFNGRIRIIRHVTHKYDTVGTDARKIIKQILDTLGFSHFDIAASFVMGKNMRDLNLKFRKVDTPTDILSFPMDPPAGEGIPVEWGDTADLGELIICIPYAHTMAALRLDHLEHHRGMKETNDLKMREAEIVDKVTTSSTPLYNVEIDPDNRPIPSMTIDYLTMDTFNAPLRYIHNRTDSYSVEDIESIRVDEQNLERIFTKKNVDIDIALVTQTKGEKKRSKRLRVLHPEIYDQLKNNAQIVNTEVFAGSYDNSNTLGLVPSPYDVNRVTAAMVDDEIPVLIVHGILHLLGYDHHTKEARDSMQRKTDELMEVLHQKKLISSRALDVSRYYVLDNVEPEAEIRKIFGDAYVESSTGNPFNPKDICYTNNNNFIHHSLDIATENAQPTPDDIDPVQIAKDIESNPALKSVLLNADVDILDAEGRISPEKIAKVDWTALSELSVDIDSNDESLDNDEPFPSNINI